MPNKVDNNCWLEGFCLVHLWPRRCSNAAGLEEIEIQGTLLFVCFFFRFGSQPVFVLQCVSEVPWMLRSAVNVKQEIFTRWTYCFSQCRDLPDVVIKDTVSETNPVYPHLDFRAEIFWLRLAESVDSVMRQPHCPHPDFYSRPPTSTLLRVFFFLHISYISVKQWLTFWNSESLFFLMTFQFPLQRSPREKCHWVLSM